jgi:Bacterial Ig-like domain (group 2)
MAILRRFRIGAVLIVFVGLIAACDKSPTGPSIIPQPGITPTTATIVRLEIQAPASIAPGQSAQLTAQAVMSDGSTENFTARVQWSSANTGLVQVSPSGVVTAVQVGEGWISALYSTGANPVHASARVLVLVPGTYKLSGRITDNGTALAEVTVTVLSGVGAGQTTMSGLDGAFAVYGVGGRVRLQATRAGYLNKMEELDIGAIATHNFEMVPDGQRTDLSGTYTLTITLGACLRPDGQFADELRSRRFSATLTQRGGGLHVSLSGAEFIMRDGRGDRFKGLVDPNGTVTFTLGDPYDYYLTDYTDLVERVNGTTAFMAYGTVNARATANGISGTLTGPAIAAPANNPSYFSRIASCYSERHVFEMRRQ